LFNIVKGIAVPYLTLESVNYQMGIGQNAQQSFSFRGDSLYYVPGSPYTQSFTLTGVGPYTLAHTALPYTESGDTFHVLSACVHTTTTNAYHRLFFDATAADGYTDTTTTITLNTDWTSGGAYNLLRVVYGSATAATYLQTVHENVSVKPAAVRPK